MEDLDYIRYMLWQEYQRGILASFRFHLKEYRPINKFDWEWDYLIDIIYECLYFNLYSLNDLIYLMCVNKRTNYLMKLMINAHTPKIPFYKYISFPDKIIFDGNPFYIEKKNMLGNSAKYSRRMKKKIDKLRENKQLLDNVVYSGKIWHPKLCVKLKAIKYKFLRPPLSIFTCYINDNQVKNYVNAPKCEKKQIRTLYFKCGFNLIYIPTHEIRQKNMHNSKSIQKIQHNPTKKSETNYQNIISNRKRTSPKKYNMNMYHTTGFKRKK